MNGLATAVSAYSSKLWGLVFVVAVGLNMPYFLLLIWFLPVGLLHGYVEATLVHFLPSMLPPVTVAYFATTGGLLVSRIRFNSGTRYLLSAVMLVLAIVHALVYDVERMVSPALLVPLGTVTLWFYLKRLESVYGARPSVFDEDSDDASTSARKQAVESPLGSGPSS